MEDQATAAPGRNLYYEGQYRAEEPADTAQRLALVAERDRLRAQLAVLRGLPLVEIGSRTTPCGECHIQPGERCDICGALGSGLTFELTGPPVGHRSNDEH